LFLANRLGRLFAARLNRTRRDHHKPVRPRGIRNRRHARRVFQSRAALMRTHGDLGVEPMRGVSLFRIASVMLAVSIAGLVSFPIFSGAGILVDKLQTSLNRMFMDDHLPPAGPEERRLPASTRERQPFGCDSAFSPVASPELAEIFRRCSV
jgi:hypothetical protein